MYHSRRSSRTDSRNGHTNGIDERCLQTTSGFKSHHHVCHTRCSKVSEIFLQCTPPRCSRTHLASHNLLYSRTRKRLPRSGPPYCPPNSRFRTPRRCSPLPNRRRRNRRCMSKTFLRSRSTHGGTRCGSAKSLPTVRIITTSSTTTHFRSCARTIARGGNAGKKSRCEYEYRGNKSYD